MSDNTNLLLDEIKKTLQNIKYGSVEIIVQDRKVTQISVRSIHKTNFIQEYNFSGSKNGQVSKKAES